MSNVTQKNGRIRWPRTLLGDRSGKSTGLRARTASISQGAKNLAKTSAVSEPKKTLSKDNFSKAELILACESLGVKFLRGWNKTELWGAIAGAEGLEEALKAASLATK